MLDHKLVVEASWKTAWLDRMFAPLDCYISLTLLLFSTTILTLIIAGGVITRKALQQSRVSPDPAGILEKMQRKLLKMTRAHFAFAALYLINATVLTMTDAVICMGMLKDDVVSEPDAWTNQLIIESVLYAVYLLVIFTATFILVPMLQMLLITYLLSRFSAQHGSHALNDYIADARTTSTYMAQIWATVAFWVTAFWAPTSSASFWRYVVLQAAVGSALAWLQASFAFNFRAAQLADQDIVVGDEGVADILRMFGKAAKVSYVGVWKEKLPLYEAVAQEDEGRDS